MPVNERIMSPGSWSLELLPTARKAYWKDISEFGHIIITPQKVDYRLFDDDAMLAMARYSGVILKKTHTENGITLEGQGPVWWLGDSAGRGEIYETKIALTSSSLDNAMDQLLPQAIAKGTITEPAGTTATEEHQWETPLEAIRTVVANMGCEYRVNPDFTLDAGPNNDVFNIDAPVIIVTRGRYSGSDVLYRGVDVDEMRSILDSENYVTRGIVTTLVGGQDRTPTTTYYDPQGNLMVRKLQLQASGSPVDVTTYLTTQMNENTIVQNMEISTEFTEIQNGDLRVGDAFWCWDPPAFYDNDNEVHFRGQVINPIKLRLLAASWPVTNGMGVYYRPPTAAPVALDWIDLSDQFFPEQVNSNRLTVR